MTTLNERIQSDLVAAMRAREELRLSTLRMAKSALKNREIEKRHPLDDQEARQVLASLIKQREESIAQFQQGGRQDLVDKEKAEIVILETYLPRQLSPEEMSAALDEVLAETGAKSAREMGAVMKAAMARFQAQQARVDGKQLSELVRRKLGG